jgi:squalene-hopene/tetraprenyl-beta-curcumene cyclase
MWKASSKPGWTLVVVLAIVVSASGAARAAGAGPAVGPDPQKLSMTIQKAVNFLGTSQDQDGAFTKPAGMGITALVTTALLRSGRSPNDPVVAKALTCLQGYVHKDGGIYTPGTSNQNYETCVAIQCLAEANRDGRYKKQIAAAEKFLKKIQWGEEQGKDKSDRFYGGAGYGHSKRPDLSNTSFLMDALKGCGRGPEDEAMKKALVFVSRCQNLETEYNTTPFPAKNPDGGFYYTCAGEGGSAAGKTPEGGLRSYASMTYSGLKSMIYAGVKPDDPRVKAAVTWAAKHYDLSTNPGMGGKGLYYYYHVFGKALAASGYDLFTDAQGQKHDWRKELCQAIAERQQKNGSWINSEDRWMEGDPNLVTGYALLALSYCHPKAYGK